MEQQYINTRKAPKDAGFEPVGVFHKPFHHSGTMEQALKTLPDARNITTTK